MKFLNLSILFVLNFNFVTGIFILGLVLRLQWENENTSLKTVADLSHLVVTLVKMLSISVADVLVTLVGWHINGSK